MTSWQAERFALEHQADTIVVTTTSGTFDGRPPGVRFDSAQRRLCLRLTRSSWPTRSIPVESIRSLSVVA